MCCKRYPYVNVKPSHLFDLPLGSNCIKTRDVCASPSYFNTFWLLELFTYLSDLPLLPGDFWLPIVHCISRENTLLLCEGCKVCRCALKRAAPYIKPSHFCLVEPQLWEVKGNGSDEAKLSRSVGKLTDQNGKHRPSTVTSTLNLQFHFFLLFSLSKTIRQEFVFIFIKPLVWHVHIISHLLLKSGESKWFFVLVAVNSLFTSPNIKCWCCCCLKCPFCPRPLKENTVVSSPDSCRDAAVAVLALFSFPRWTRERERTKLISPMLSNGNINQSGLPSRILHKVYTCTFKTQCSLLLVTWSDLTSPPERKAYLYLKPTHTDAFTCKNQLHLCWDTSWHCDEIAPGHQARFRKGLATAAILTCQNTSEANYINNGSILFECPS